jgi:C4-dicarboxylate-specific signal transduction histidine kinase
MLESLRILIVDDDEVDRLAVLQALEQSEIGAKVKDVESLASARSALRDSSFNCVILDHHLRDGLAIQLLKEASRGLLDLPPVIILTASYNHLPAIELIEAGATDYVPKNELTPSRIAQSVRNALLIRDSQKALALAYKDLEVRVEARTAELKIANQELKHEIASRLEAERQAHAHLTQLAHVARLSTLGEMASGLAHELNQPLGAIANYANGSLRRLEAGTVDKQLLLNAVTNIAIQAERGGKIIQRLRSLVTRKEPKIATTDLNRLLKEVAALEGPEAHLYEVEIVFDLDLDLPTVQADQIQIQQVALNLMRNGIEAAQATDTLQRKVIVRTRARTDQRIEASFTDCGPVCDPTALEQMFDPFFTTKERGMGVGLTISRSIIKAHRGELWAVPNQEGGLSFYFTLPVGMEE